MARRRAQESLSNANLAELLAAEAEHAKYPVQKALRKAGRSAFLWPAEARDLLYQNRSLTELAGVGPFIAKLIESWIKKPPELPAPNPIRKHFFTWPEAQRILQAHPDFKREIRGDLQMHTEWSDGSGTVQSMAEAAVARGYEYISITDHGKRLKIAGGINEQELAEQAREIAAVNETYKVSGLRVLRSIELNLDVEGRGDMESKALAKLDIVLGAFHSALRKTEDQTDRYLAALENPDLHILGHPRGRIYNYRLGLKADWPKVLRKAAGVGKAVEIDSYPDRQDLSIDLLRVARDEGTMISIGTDAHHPWQLEFIDFGLAAAVEAGIPKERILNFKPLKELQKWVARLRG